MGFRGSAKAFQLGAVMDANDTIQTGNQHLFGTGIQIPAGQGMDAAFEQGKILSVHVVADQRQQAARAPTNPPSLVSRIMKPK